MASKPKKLSNRVNRFEKKFKTMLKIVLKGLYHEMNILWRLIIINRFFLIQALIVLKILFSKMVKIFKLKVLACYFEIIY